jgi:hypothetical protein
MLRVDINHLKYMGKAYKNFWALNTDEAVAAGILKDETAKDVEVLMPLNAQMKDVDLVVANVKSRKYSTIQVKGSRAYEPQRSETDKFGAGSAGWFFFHSDIIKNSDVDYFIFLIYVIEESTKTGRRHLRPHTITIPTQELKKSVNKYKSTHGDGRYSFFIWVNPETKTAFEFRDRNYDLSKYLDKKGFIKLNKYLNG